VTVEAAAGGKREATKAANRAAILEAASDVFAEIGFGAATVRDIVRRTDLATGTFYNYFPDKESVLRALFDEVAAEARAGFGAYYEFLAEDRRMFDLLRRNAGTIRTLFDEPGLLAGVGELEEDLRAAIAAGAMPEVDVELMARAMVGAGFEVGVLMLEGDPPDVERAVTFVTDLFLGGIERMAR
jgi:AcrR family transcriptional regulator